MSAYPIEGYGLPSKMRSTEPSMFQILSWPCPLQIQKPLQQRQQFSQMTNLKKPLQSIGLNDYNQPPATCCHILKGQNQQPKKFAQEVHASSLLQQKSIQNEAFQPLQQQKHFKKSVNFKKNIKNELNSFEPANLKASRSKSAAINQKNENQKQPKNRKEEAILDEKTINERKKKIKEFQFFTRILPNSAFTTYYGKPTFQSYGRGTSFKNLKSFNVMPHKGQNHPHEIQSHYTALLKARKTPSKSHLPRKPIDSEPLKPLQDLNNKEQTQKSFNLPLEKPDLVHSNRFAIVAFSKKNISRSSRTLQDAKNVKKSAIKTKKKKKKQSKLSNLLLDGLKFSNQRQNLIDLLEQKKLKASQLAYKVTECYPLNFEFVNSKKCSIAKENWNELKPAGKPSIKGDPVGDLIQSRFFQQNISQVS